ncbi:MAG: sensor histidine kinase [Ardenticatenaceae bacterium]
MQTTMNYMTQPRPVLPLRFVGGVLLALVGALAVFTLLMRPPVNEFGLMATFLTITAVVSIVAGYGAYRLGWIRFSPHLSWTLLGGYALSSVLTFLNVFVTAQLMFASSHDLMLATVLLIFASGIAMSLGYFFSAAVTTHVVMLSRAAGAIAAGQLDARVPVQGRDEMAALARSFNQMAEQLEIAANERRRTEKLRRDLIAWVGHDLRTPLASMRAVVEALADEVVVDPPTVQRYLRMAQHDIRSLSMLIDDLFEMAQLDAGGLPLQREPNSLADLISDTIESFSALAEQRGVSLVGTVAHGVDPVLIDAQKIGRVLSNLVSNALRHTPPGGSVEVSARPAGDVIEVAIIDSGEGIKEEDLPHIFDQFYRGEKSRSRSTGGSGLGLAIAKRIIEAHHGHITADSRPGAGTRIVFTVPRATP